jgi:glycerol-1-phosphate dehydrogenase [NAD(P)+]
MQLPREVLLGAGTLAHLPSICKKLGFSESAVVITGALTYKIAGHSVMDLLQDSGIETTCMVVSSPTATQDMEDVRARIRTTSPQVVIGVGGGTKIDTAKLAAAYENVPFISVPTTASHDGIASPLASIRGAKKPYSIMARAPMAIIADTSIIIQAPHHYAASGCGDVLAKFTAVRDWHLAHKANGEYYGEYAASLALMSAKLIARNANLISSENQEGLHVLLEGLISCGVSMSIAGSSRPCSGSEHLFSHALNMKKSGPALHGEKAAVGTIMMASLQGLNWRHIKAKLRQVGAPTTADQLGVESEDVIESLVKARTVRPERYTILTHAMLTQETAKSVAQKTGVI